MSASSVFRHQLDLAGVPYEHREHPVWLVDEQLARFGPFPPEEFAKSVAVKADGSLVLVVVPPDKEVDLNRVKFIRRSENIDFASEADFKKVFPSCEVGAIPPFHNLSRTPVYCDTLLGRNDSIAFDAGDHEDEIRMALKDFKRLSIATMADLVQHRPRP